MPDGDHKDFWLDRAHKQRFGSLGCSRCQFVRQEHALQTSVCEKEQKRILDVPYAGALPLGVPKWCPLQGRRHHDGVR
jgi:hypothetical protein